MKIEPITVHTIDDLGTLLCSQKTATGCWCMWFILPVKQYQAAGSDGNRAAFRELVLSCKDPVGLLGYVDGAPAGWCAVGPRSRYSRAIKTPTYRGRQPDEDENVWLLPCLFVRKELRGSGLSTCLIHEAVHLARTSGATAIEAFPFTGTKRQTYDTQVGFQSAFSRCGFHVIRKPSNSRAIMRLDFSFRTDPQ